MCISVELQLKGLVYIYPALHFNILRGVLCMDGYRSLQQLAFAMLC